MNSLNIRTRWLYALCASTLFSIGASAAWSPRSGARNGSGWTMTRLDLDVRVLPDEARIEHEGTLHLRLDQHDSSYGPDLLLNRRWTATGDPVMSFFEVDCPGAEVRLPAELRSGAMRQAKIRFERPKSRGDELRVEFTAASEGVGARIITTEEVALASWTSGWHPLTNPTARPRFSFNAGVLHVPGQTRLHLPAAWIGIADFDISTSPAPSFTASFGGETHVVQRIED